MKLNNLRDQIDSIDRDLVELFKARMAVLTQIAEYKRENGMPILDSAREEELLMKISELAGDELGEYAQKLYATILEISREYQAKKL